MFKFILSSGTYIYTMLWKFAAQVALKVFKIVNLSSNIYFCCLLAVLFKDIAVLILKTVFKLRNFIASLIDCLHASTVVPDFAPQPLKYKPGEEQLNFVNGAKMEL